MLRLSSLILFFVVSHFACIQNATLPNKDKINGVSFVSPSQPISDTLVAVPKIRLNANWLTLMPFAFLEDNSALVKYNLNWQWWGEKSEGIIALINMAKQKGYKIMLKPQLWIHGGDFTGHLKFHNEADWEIFEESYQSFILEFAEIAESENVEIFCIGTELELFVKERSNFWSNLIHESKQLFSGKLTYAANWDEFEKVHFWGKLDYIGIDAYFPLSQKQDPTLSDLIKGWNSIGNKLESFSKEIDRPIIFTEYGLRSKKGAAKQPWDSGLEGAKDIDLQRRGYTALYETLWHKDYFLGGFIWKWFPNHQISGGSNDNGFTPQNKATEKVINKYYRLYSTN